MENWRIERTVAVSPGPGSDADAAYLVTVGYGQERAEVIVELAAPSAVASAGYAEEVVRKYLADDEPPQQMVWLPTAPFVSRPNRCTPSAPRAANTQLTIQSAFAAGAARRVHARDTEERMILVRDRSRRGTPANAEALAARVKQRLRGALHETAFYVTVVLAVALIVTAEPGTASLAATIYAAAVAFCFGASALYHRPTWRPGVRSWLARLDHAAIAFWILPRA